MKEILFTRVARASWLQTARFQAISLVFGVGDP
jgi:hypothetical protein